MPAADKLVNLFIVGAPKCGTTTLYHFLKDHPDIYMSDYKETNHFSYDDLLSDGLYYSEKGLRSITEYRSKFDFDFDVKYYGEASVSYLFYPAVAQRIYDYNKDSRIIIMLRNPIERAFSHYLMDLRLGYANGVSFNDLVFNEGAAFTKHYQQYIELGFYSKQVERYIEVFGKENVCVMIAENFREKRRYELSKLAEFLGVPESGFDFDAQNRNSYKEPRNKLFKYLYSSSVLRMLARKTMPTSLVGLIKSLFFRHSVPPVISSAARLHLRKAFMKDVIVLSGLLGCKQLIWDEFIDESD